MNDNIYRQIYNVSEDSALLTNINDVICVFLRRGMLSAGFNGNCDLLTIHYNAYKSDKPVWDLDFFEHVIAQEPLLKDRKKVSRVFTFSDKGLLIPDELYDINEAAKWIGKIHFKEANDVLETYRFTDDKVHLVQLVPMNISELIKINFANAFLLPLCVYQFRNNYNSELMIKCCITNEQASVTLHFNKMLLWHRIFDYANAADIAYQIMFFCRENQWDTSKLLIECDCITETENTIANDLCKYFKTETLKNAKGSDSRDIHTRWSLPVSLVKKLFLCA